MDSRFGLELVHAKASCCDQLLNEVVVKPSKAKLSENFAEHYDSRMFPLSLRGFLEMV